MRILESSSSRLLLTPQPPEGNFSMFYCYCWRRSLMKKFGLFGEATVMLGFVL